MMQGTERHMSRRVEVSHPDGGVEVHPLSIVAICGGRYEVRPYSEEIPGVIYHDRPLRLTLSADGQVTLTEITS